VVLCFEPVVFRKTVEGGSSYWAVLLRHLALIVGGILATRRASPRSCRRWKCWTT
jgi:hypothetical protein